ncbi:MAG: protein kinase [Planctomycetes bacterium]|nr:protein kinase [Planctomycetota bacterium]
MNDPGPDPSRHKAVLAAVLAVQRGFLSPDEAVRVLAELKPNSGPDPMQTLLSVAPTSAQAAISAEVEALAEKPETLAATLSEMGVNAEAQSTLLGLKPDTSSEAATKALSSLADRRRRIADMTSRLPSSDATGRYQVKREFARGGMGLIWVAVDSAVGREVALKELLPPKLGAGTSHVTDSPEIVERFLREAKVTGQLEHPNIVPVYEIATRADGSVFYTMKLVRGKTMAHRLLQVANGAGTTQEKMAQRLKLLDAFVDVCNAIAYAHSRGVIHRDIKPANIMLGDFGETLVLDWGLARVLGQDESSGVRKKAEQQAFSPSLLQDDSENRTLDGAILGTPAYMPPEQARGALELVDERADVYALGSILYEILSGRPPYEGKNAREVLAKVLVLSPEPLAKVAPIAPPDLVSLAEKAMEREPRGRLESAEKLAAEVLAFRDGRELSVYRYSTAELLKRFVGRHKAAVGVACGALVLIIAGAIYAFENIARERDQAELNLQAADREREARVDAEKKQQAERERLIRAREGDITAQRRKFDGLRGDNLAAEARVRIDEMKARRDAGATLAPADREENARIVSGLLAVAAVRAELVRLMTAPVAGQVHEFVSQVVLDEETGNLRADRLLAVELALLNEDFALASFILEGTDADETTLALKRWGIEAARSSLLLRHRDAIEMALDDVRKNIARGNRPQGSIRLEDYVIRLASFHEAQTVELLSAALQPYVDRATKQGKQAFWTQVERDEITLICRVLGYLDVPDLAVPVLASFMAVVDDPRLAIECGSALCQTSSERAYGPLVDARSRFGPRGYVWRRVSRWFDRVPEPANLSAPTTAEGLLDLAEIRRIRNDREGAAVLVDKALELEPENVRGLVAKAGLQPDGNVALALCQQAIALKADDASAWAALANWQHQLNRHAEATKAGLRALELRADDARSALNVGYYYYI